MNIALIYTVALVFAVLFTILFVEFIWKSKADADDISEEDFMRTKNYQVFKIIEQDLINNLDQYTSLWSFGGGINRSVQRKGNHNGYLTILIMEDGSIILPVDMTNQPRKYKDIIKKHVDEIYRADLNKVIKNLQDEKY